MSQNPLKVLFIAPHLSTGGMPQYLLKMIQVFKNQYDIEVVEVDNLSNDYVVQRDKIKKECKLYQIEGDQTKLINLLKDQQYDIIHFQEIPETFINEDILLNIYKQDRTYQIRVTTHSSYVNFFNIKFTPDQFILVSNWSKKQFEKKYPGICDIWEYPVERVNDNPLEWDISYKHILHVGLFTPGKNQKELIEIAKHCIDKKILFHFVGNQAINFKEYWEPLMSSLPSNCIIHGEVGNVHEYYQSADLFYFPSLFELNPLAVKEAISYGVPTMLRKLPTYENVYDGRVRYISDNIQENIDSMYQILGITNKHDIYTDIQTNEEIIVDQSIKINYVNGPYVEINNAPGNKFFVEFIDANTGIIEYSGEIESNHWIKANKSYYVNWLIKINGEEYRMDLTDRRVYISIESSALGDNLAWIPYVEEFRKKHNCKVICSTFHNDLFKDTYPEIEFVNPGSSVNNIIALYRIGWYYNQQNQVNYDKVPFDFKKEPLQKTAANILGIDYQEITPKLNLPKRNIKKQVCIAIHGTAQAKYWNNPTGWQEVVDHLNTEGYDVILLSKEPDGYMGNNHPTGIKQIHGSLNEIINTLRESTAFIGIGSGLSWLSWACKIPTIIISGFSEAYTEPLTNITRVTAPTNKCSGCFNRCRLDAGDWNWCPDHKNTDRQFECSKSITSQDVINLIKYF